MSRVQERCSDPGKRVSSFDEVNLGYDEDAALAEASRCLLCKNAECVQACPAGIDIPGFIKLIRQNRIDESLSRIIEKNILPGVCGRVCPYEKNCEAKCILAKKGEPIAIAALERFAADNAKPEKAGKADKTGIKAAVVGSGPASLSCAARLASKGYKVKMFEALHKPGGVLQYGIPEFRLPRKVVDREIKRVMELGVDAVFDCVIGKTKTLSELSEEFDAVFIGTGAGTPNLLGIEGEDLQNVYSANEFLVRVNLMNAHKFPEYRTPVKKGAKVVVIGGGDVALDAARVARRLGSEVTIIYRRNFSDMPARQPEIRNAQDEGVQMLTLTSPARFAGEKKVEAVECVQMREGEEDETGRRAPVPIEGTEFTIECDQAIIAVGQNPNQAIAKTGEIMTGGFGNIIVDESMRTSKENVFAGGDAVSGSATVINAVRDGNSAAEKIDEYLNSRQE